MRTPLLGSIVLLGLLGLAGASPALAQSDQMTVKVPFSFVIGRTTLPAGSYQLAVDNLNVGLVVLTNTDGKDAAVVLTNWAGPYSWAGSGRQEDNSLLEFRKVEGKYYLTAIRVPGENTREVVLPEPPEQVQPHHVS